MSGDFTALKSPEILFISAMSRKHKPRWHSNGLAGSSGRCAAMGLQSLEGLLLCTLTAVGDRGEGYGHAGKAGSKRPGGGPGNTSGMKRAIEGWWRVRENNRKPEQLHHMEQRRKDWGKRREKKKTEANVPLKGPAVEVCLDFDIVTG